VGLTGTTARTILSQVILTRPAATVSLGVTPTTGYNEAMQFRLRTLLIVLAVLAVWPVSAESAYRRRRSRLCPTPVRTQPERLGDIGTPDEKERKLNGVLVLGSELTDAHVKSICRLTENTKPQDFDGHWLRGIIHAGPNRADHIWQTAHYQTYQKLELENGSWRIVETGAGFGNFGRKSK
jgi:hypothetical protein